MYGAMASKTRGSSGVVELMSKYAARPSRNSPRIENGLSPAAAASEFINDSGTSVVGWYRLSEVIFSCEKDDGACASEFNDLDVVDVVDEAVVVAAAPAAGTAVLVATANAARL